MNQQDIEIIVHEFEARNEGTLIVACSFARDIELLKKIIAHKLFEDTNIYPRVYADRLVWDDNIISKEIRFVTTENCRGFNPNDVFFVNRLNPSTEPPMNQPPTFVDQYMWKECGLTFADIFYLLRDEGWTENEIMRGYR